MPPQQSAHQILAEVGRGGMGVVYLARHSVTGDLIVVKQLLPDLAAREDLRTMFLDEARLAARLDHPNVVRTLEVGIEPPNYFLAMEYLDGQPLDAIARDASGTGGLPVALILHVVTEVLAGLHAAHELRAADGTPLAVVHRDVSPHNVMVTYEGVVKVLDFGIAKAADSTARTRTGGVKGKLGYMAPEQATRRGADRRADIFSCGILFWQLLHRRRFWGDLPDEEIFLRLREGSIAPEPGEPDDVPTELDALCLRAFHVDPAERYQTADELRSLLLDYAARRALSCDSSSLAAYVCDAFSAEREGSQEQIRRIGSGESSAFPLAAWNTSEPNAIGNLLPQTIPDYLGAPERASPGRARSKGPLFARGRTLLAIALAASAIVVFGVVRGSRNGRAPSRTATGCTVPSDCQPLGPLFACSSTGVCELRAGCLSNVACSRDAGGLPSVCRKGSCVALETSECHIRASPDAVDREDTLWIGTMFPLRGPDAAEFGKASAAAAELARREWTEAAGGLPLRSGDGKPRSLGIIECDDTDEAHRGAAHLVEVGVPAVIGFHSSAEVLDLAATTFIPSRTFVVASINRSPMITRIPMPAGTPRLVWRTAGSIADNVASASTVIKQLFEPKLRASLRGKPLRVAVVRANNPTGRAAADAFVTTLEGGTSSSGYDGRAFHDIAYDAATTATTGIDYSAPLRALRELRPHVVILVADLAGEGLIAHLEASWPVAEPRPFYLLAGPLEEEALYTWIGASAERRHRVFGLFPPRHTPANARFVMHFNETFRPAVTEVDSPAGPYDAFYLLAYAAYAAGEERPTGLGIAQAIARLTAIGQKKVDVGPLDLFDGLTALRSGAAIDLDGALGTMDFDPITGDSASDMALLCIAVGEGGQARGELESGLVYRHVRGELAGVMRCP